MSLDIAKISRDFTANFETNGFNLKVGSGAKNGLTTGNGAFPGNRIGCEKPNFNQTNGLQQSSQLQQVFDFAMNLVKTVLDFVKNGTSVDSATAAAPTPGEQAVAAPASGNTPTSAEGTHNKDSDIIGKLKEALVAIEKQLTELGKALSSLSKGATDLGDTAASELAGMIKKGIKIGKKFSSISKKLGF